MIEPKIVLKNVKTFQGHDGGGFNADIWINGVNCMHVYDGAYGGEFEYTENIFKNPKAKKVEENIALLHKYVDQLPEVETDFIKDGKPMMIKYGLDVYIDKILIKQEQAKIDKRFDAKKKKSMQTSILFGKPNEKRYSILEYKRPLSSFSTDKLQEHLNTIVLKHCKKGVEILNTNLEALGLVINY